MCAGVGGRAVVVGMLAKDRLGSVLFEKKKRKAKLKVFSYIMSLLITQTLLCVLEGNVGDEERSGVQRNWKFFIIIIYVFFL